MTDISTGSTATCRYCGHEIVYQPWFLDGRNPNPPVWSHVKSGVKSCSTCPVGWEADRWPFATPAVQDPHEAATVRDAARQTTGQDDTEVTCAHCQGTGADPEDQGDYDPSVHMYNPTTIGPCPECHGTGKDAPAVGQPAEAHDTDARPPRVQWRVEGYDADVWLPVSRSFDSSADAHARKHADTRYPDMPTRVVRETTTWTVEGER